MLFKRKVFKTQGLSKTKINGNIQLRCLLNVVISGGGRGEGGGGVLGVEVGGGLW